MANARELDALLAKAMMAHQAGQLAEAQKSYKAVLKQVPEHFPALHFLGLSYFQQGHSDAGIAFVQKALAIKPDYAEAHYNLATALSGLGRSDQAVEHYKKVLVLDPNNPDAHNNLGAILLGQKRYDEAIGHFEQALTIRPNYVPSHSNIGAAFKELKRFGEAVTHLERAVAIESGNAEIWCNLGGVLLELESNQRALAAYDRAAALDSGFAEAQLGRGNALSKLGRLDEAVAAFESALSKKDNLAESWLGLGHVRGTLKQYDKAVLAYDAALKFQPQLEYVHGYRLHAKMHNCDWTNFEADCAQIIDEINSGRLSTIPFLMLSVTTSAAAIHRCAQLYIQDRHRQSKTALWDGKRYSHERIRIAYLSADFREHALAYLMVGVIEHHDKSRFEVIGLSVGPSDESAMRARLEGAFEEFIYVREKSDLEIARLIREKEVDILVDLVGLTQGGRVNVLAMRPAPLQVNYMCYASTMGADYIDYIVADKVVIPENLQQHYSEKVVYLPQCYLAYDASRSISETTPTRQAVGLPESGFVFCCFNNSYKINPAMFDVWMNLLRTIDDSVLWLLEGPASSSENLRREAQRRGVSAERIVFAPRSAHADHLARHRVADLFLDTLPYNAHTTACDALWAGLPVVTCQGEAFAGRVAGSLLKAVGLPELITQTPDEYESLAVSLARDRELLASIKAKLARNRLTWPLFDNARSARDVEQAYTTMWRRQQDGLPPAMLSVDASG